MPEGSGEHSFRLQGELEKAHPDIEPLPPTPITPDAKERLESWGVPERFVTRLQELTSSMRYDLSPQKAERVARNGGYIYETPEGANEVILPDFYNRKDRLDGQCGDISIQFLNVLHTSGYIGDLRTVMEEEGSLRINPCIVQGLSRTHFNNQVTADRSWSHRWTGLLPEGGSLDDMITVDPSFQEISSIRQNGYQIMESIVDPSGINEQATSASCEVGSANITKDGVEILRYMTTIVLGSSSDGELVYDFSFIKDQHGKLHPVVVAQTSDGARERPECIGDVNGSLHFSNDAPLTREQRTEMEAVCNNLLGLSLIKDQVKAKELKEKRTNIQFE